MEAKFNSERSLCIVPVTEFEGDWLREFLEKIDSNGARFIWSTDKGCLVVMANALGPDPEVR